jgi:tetratricopeptide (TPR) repeat protein
MSVHFLTALMLSLAVSLGTGCDWSSPEAKKAKHLERAKSYFDKGQYQEAVIEYANVAKIDPKDADAQYKFALSLLKVGGLPNLRQAYAALSRAVELDNTNQDAQLKLGELYLRGNEPAKARERAEIVLVSAPQNTEGLILRGRSLINEKRYREGIAELKKAIELDPQNIQIYVELARAHYAAGDLITTEATLNQALSVNPRSTEAMLALGDFRTTTGKLDQAEMIYKKALEMDTQNDSIYIRLTDIYQRQNKLADAEATLQKLATNKPQDDGPHIRLGDFLMSIGKLEKALANYQRAVEIQPTSLLARDKLIGYYLDTGKTNEAELKVKEILAKNDKDLMGRFFDARILVAKHKPDEAIPILQGIVRDEPQFAGAHHILGMAFLQKNEKGQAHAAFSEAIKINPRFSEARTALAQIYLADGSLDLAIEESQAAIQSNPRNIQAAIISGDAYLRKGDTAKSKQVFEALAKALPNEPLPLYRLGLVARAEKNDGKALAYFEDALNKKPSAIEPLTQIVSIKLAQGKEKDARERVGKQIEVSPNDPHLYNLLGQIWVQLKDSGQAQAAFKKAIELDSSLLSSYMNLAQTYYRSGRVDQAENEYRTVVGKNPKVLSAQMMLGVIHESKKEYDKAQARYEAILKIDPRFAPAANNLAWIMTEQSGNLDVALSLAQTAREIRPTDPYVADTLGWVYYKKNAYLLSLSLLKEAVDKLPTDPVIHFHYGMVQLKNGDSASAKKSLQTALKLNDDFPGSAEAKKTLSSL